MIEKALVAMLLLFIGGASSVLIAMMMDNLDSKFFKCGIRTMAGSWIIGVWLFVALMVLRW